MIQSGTSRLFEGIPPTFDAIRYHSLVVDPDTLPNELKVTAATEDGTIMALEHERLQVYGVQFHPESVLSEYGMDILRNFIKMTKTSNYQGEIAVRGGVA